MGRIGAPLWTALCSAMFVGLAAIPVEAQQPDETVAADVPSVPGTASLPASAQTEPSPTGSPLSGISGNVAAVNVETGTGWLGQQLGFGPDSGVRVGGVWVGNANFLLTGGEKSVQSSFNSLLVADLKLDLGRLGNIPGGQFGAQFLQFNGQPTNAEAGVITGYNGLTGPPPLVRSELYQLWWRQALFDEKLVVRVGKLVPTYDFNNVARPVRTRDESLAIPAVTGLIYTPAFVNTTMLGVLPGYYNSAYGITTTLAPTESLYFSYGAYDGNGVRKQTGLDNGPRFNGYYFNIAEAGYAWTLGSGTLPGGVAAGGWHQTGLLAIAGKDIAENGASGFYAFGSQRLWSRHPGIDSSGVSGFFQFGINDSRTLVAHRYVGFGATGFGLIPGRPADTVGAGIAWSWLNQNLGFNNDETILAAYYQAKVLDSLFLQPVITYVPNPGATPGHAPVVAVTIQTTILF
jgi:porin